MPCIHISPFYVSRNVVSYTRQNVITVWLVRDFQLYLCYGSCRQSLEGCVSVYAYKVATWYASAYSVRAKVYV